MSTGHAPGEWQPPPGMFKLDCARCRHAFAAALSDEAVCPTCRSVMTRRHTRRRASASPFDTGGDSGHKVGGHPGRET